MAKLTCSLEEGSRLLLLGDKDQLASVEPGAVFGDICDTDSINIFCQSSLLARKICSLSCLIGKVRKILSRIR